MTLEMTLKSIDPLALQQRLDDGTAVLVDIRERDEYAREHIPGARLVSLSELAAHDFDRERDRAVVFHCKSGNRTRGNAGTLAAKTKGEAYVLAGGLDAWKAAGLPTRSQQAAAGEGRRKLFGVF